MARAVAVVLLGSLMVPMLAGCAAVEPPKSAAPVSSVATVGITGEAQVSAIAGVPAGPGTAPADATDPLSAGIGSATPSGDRILGTDSEVAAPTPLSPELEASLVAFGQHYLAYDFRLDAATRAEALRPLVTATLLEQLIQPVPPALAATLEAEQRVVTATLTEIRPLDVGSYLLTYSVHTHTEANGSSPATDVDEPRTLVVSVDDTQRVSDVR